METRGHGDAGTRRRGDAGTRRRGDAGTRRRGDAETRRHGDTETRRRGDAETRREGFSCMVVKKLFSSGLPSTSCLLPPASCLLPCFHIYQGSGEQLSTSCSPFFLVNTKSFSPTPYTQG
ncbi:MAG: hypothetical protein F6K41_37565 [Symploca sp. SIO3E6]|nr:hypothetical protein [Caldora sp. SIO3E6]